MLRFRKGVLYYKKHESQLWREVPEAQHAKRWEQRAKELEAYAVSIANKYKAVTAELEEVSEQLAMSQNMLRLSAKDNLAKDVMIKSLTNKDVKNEMDFNTNCSN
jgi:molecular chaperone GrpE (heat shock protein)